MNYDEIATLMKESGPIGSYVKKLNHAFEHLIRDTQYGKFDRADWQLINYLHTHKEQTIQRQSVIEFLIYFAGSAEVANLRIEKFIEKNIIQTNVDQLTWTGLGQVSFDVVYAQHKIINEQVFEHITSEQYVMTIQTLEKFLSNIHLFSYSEPIK